MMLGFARVAVALAVLPFLSALVLATSALVLPGDQAAIIVSEDGALQHWDKGKDEPTWALPIGGIGVGARSRVAAVARRPSGDIVVVERYGAINLVSKSGGLIARKSPVFPYVQFDAEVGDVDWSDWSKQVAIIAGTSAAYITQSTDFIYL